MKRKIVWSFWLKIAALLLLAPALFINLGLPTFIDDECIRSLVALEMKLSDNYITPTLHGAYYYKKPPLYNWILLLCFNLTGVVNEFTARIPTIVCLLGFAATVYYYFRKHYTADIAFLQAFLLITCGRVLFWDSLLGLIDICFSWAIFVLFMVVYHELQKGRYWSLFLLSYLFAALGFMLKGLPAIVFQGCTLLAVFIYYQQFKKLFSIQHIVGVLLFVLLVGSYYLVYIQYNGLSDLIPMLVAESSKRTGLVFGLWKTILHLFTFPFEMVYHFLPWSLMILFFIRRDLNLVIRQDGFVTYNMLIFFANILVYWVSVEVYPRYLLMFVPLIFSAFLHLYLKDKAAHKPLFRLLEMLFFTSCIIITMGSFLPLFLERTQATAYLYPKTLSVALLLALLTTFYWKLKAERLLVLVVFLLVFRVGFNWFILPDRNANDFGDLCRITSKEMGQKFKNQPLYVYKDTDMQYTNSLYLTIERQQIIPYKKDNFDKNALYIINPQQYPNVPYEKVGAIKVRHGKLTYDIAKLK
jgi:4-amino-4-deoxy-L-arabinose transferase-like glycosyltransferase